MRVHVVWLSTWNGKHSQTKVNLDYGLLLIPADCVTRVCSNGTFSVVDMPWFCLMSTSALLGLVYI